MGELVNESEGKQAKINLSSFFFYVGCFRKVPFMFRVHLPTGKSDEENPLKEYSPICFLVDHTFSQVENE